MTVMRRTPGLVFLLGSLTAFAPMSIDMYLPALPQLQRDLATDAASVQLTLASFFAAFALGQLFYGPLADRFGRKPPLYAGLILFVLASMGCLVATRIETLIVCRFLQAFGACAGVVMARAFVRDVFEGVEAARLHAAMMLVMGVAPLLAPLLGSELLRLSGWRSIFAVLVAYGALCLFLLWRHLPETLPISSRRPLRMSRVLSTYAHLLGTSRYRNLALSSSISMGGLYAFIATSPFLFTTHYGLQAASYGLLFGANAFWLILASQLNGRVVARFGLLPTLKASLALQLSAALTLGVSAWLMALPMMFLLPFCFMYTGSLGFILPNATVLAMAPYAAHAGMASGLYGTLGSLSGAVAAGIVSQFAGDDPRTLATALACCAALAWQRSRSLRD